MSKRRFSIAFSPYRLRSIALENRRLLIIRRTLGRDHEIAVVPPGQFQIIREQVFQSYRAVKRSDEKIERHAGAIGGYEGLVSIKGIGPRAPPESSCQPSAISTTSRTSQTASSSKHPVTPDNQQGSPRCQRDDRLIRRSFASR